MMKVKIKLKKSWLYVIYFLHFRVGERFVDVVIKKFNHCVITLEREEVKVAISVAACNA
mgnify:CR=1 FL=1